MDHPADPEPASPSTLGPAALCLLPPSCWSAQILQPQQLAWASVGSAREGSVTARPRAELVGTRLPSLAQITRQSWTA